MNDTWAMITPPCPTRPSHVMAAVLYLTQDAIVLVARAAVSAHDVLGRSTGS